MERIHYRISLDMFDTVSRKTLKAKKGDTACDIIITLTENGKVYQIADGCTATFTAKKPDGNFLYNTEACYIKDNNIIYNFTEQTTACEGMVDCEVVLYGADGNRLTSPRFALQVGGTVYNGEEIISTPETDMMKELIEDAEETINKMNEVMPETLPPFNIPMGNPDGSGRSIDSQIPIYAVVNKRSFVGNGYELVMVNPIQDENGKVTTAELVGSGIRFDEVALKSDLGGENWELINEVTLTEDAVVSFTTDSEGNPFELKKFKLLIILNGNPTAGALWLRINDAGLGQSQQIALKESGNPACYFYVEQDEVTTWRITSVANASGAFTVASPYETPQGHIYSGSEELGKTAKNILVSKSRDGKTVLPAGSKITLQGVRV